jgi:hypothetical protein
MACVITYNNKKYSQPEFNEYFKSHFFEFVGDFLNSTNISEITLEQPRFNPDNYEATSYPIKINGKNAGIFSVDKDGYISSSIGMAGVELNEDFQGKGYGTKVYLAVANKLAKEGKTLKSEKFGKNNINEFANRVWKSLLNKGLAVDKGDYFEVLLGSKQDIEGFKDFVENNNQSEQDNTDIVSQKIAFGEIEIIDEDSGRPCAANGMSTANFTPGSKWRVIKDLKGHPSHARGGVNVSITDNGVSLSKNGSNIQAKYGLVIKGY